MISTLSSSTNLVDLYGKSSLTPEYTKRYIEKLQSSPSKNTNQLVRDLDAIAAELNKMKDSNSTKQNKKQHIQGCQFIIAVLQTGHLSLSANSESHANIQTFIDNHNNQVDKQLDRWFIYTIILCLTIVLGICAAVYYFSIKRTKLSPVFTNGSDTSRLVESTGQPPVVTVSNGNAHAPSNSTIERGNKKPTWPNTSAPRAKAQTDQNDSLVVPPFVWNDESANTTTASANLYQEPSGLDITNVSTKEPDEHSSQTDTQTQRPANPTTNSNNPVFTWNDSTDISVASADIPNNDNNIPPTEPKEQHPHPDRISTPVSAMKQPEGDDSARLFPGYGHEPGVAPAEGSPIPFDISKF